MTIINAATEREVFVLGSGPSGTFGHVALFLTKMPLPGEVMVVWGNDGPVAPEVKLQVAEAAFSFLQAYLDINSTLLHVTITEVRSDAVRQNDYERAVKLALFKALNDMSLPTPQIFAAPEEDGLEIEGT